MSGARGAKHYYNRQSKTTGEWSIIKGCSREYMAKLISIKGIKGAMEHEFTQRRRTHDVMVTIPASSLDFGKTGWNCNNTCGKGSPPKNELEPIGTEGGTSTHGDKGGLRSMLGIEDDMGRVADEKPTQRFSNVILRGLERGLIYCVDNGIKATAMMCSACNVNGCGVRS